MRVSDLIESCKTVMLSWQLMAVHVGLDGVTELDELSKRPGGPVCYAGGVLRVHGVTVFYQPDKEILGDKGYLIEELSVAAERET